MYGEADFKSASAPLPCSLSKSPQKRDFLDIYQTTFPESVISEIQNLWKVILFVKMSKISSRFQKCSKRLTKILRFWDNCIWIGIIKLSLLRTGYFSSAANVLTGSPKIWHVKTRYFFQLNWFGSGQWMWKR